MMRFHLKFCLAPVLLFCLGACTALPDWAKPEVLYGEAFAKTKKKVGEGLKSTRPAVSVSEVNGDAEKETLTHVFEELGGDLQNRNHADQPLRGGGSVSLPEIEEAVPAAEDVPANEAGEAGPPPVSGQSDDQGQKKSVFRGLSGDF
ncbi:MAG: hypothetical protein ACON4W_04715 [Parvibaculales bacterium]